MRDMTEAGDMKRGGFTLIELMVVVAIVGILSAIALARFASLIKRSQEGATKGNLAMLRSALKLYYADNEGIYPGDNLASLTANGKYINEIPEVYVPGSHDKSRVVENNDNWGMGSMLVLDRGTWFYWNWDTPLLPRRRGDLWISCGHQDLALTPWSSY